MKKLIIVAAVGIAFATIANAAAFNWTSSGTNASKTFYGSDGSSTIAGATIYLLDAAMVAQADLVAGVRDGKTMSDFTTVTSQTLDADSRLVAKEFSYGEAGGNYNFYMAIIDNGDVFVSSSLAASGQASATVDVKFSGIKTATQTLNADGAYSSAGWYVAVPEPTSGLLLLLGMAGLALKRKRA